MTPPLGAHVSVAGGLDHCFERAADLGCTAIQIFVKNANRWQGPPLTEADVAAFRAARQASEVGPVVAHGAYLINLCATDPAVLGRSRAGLADELERCRRLGVDALVIHPGSHLGEGEEPGCATVSESLAGVLAAPDGPLLLLENTAGQGSNLGHRLEHLAAIRDACPHPERVGFCLDTCHAFAAGYPIHEPAGYEEFWQQVDEVLGLDGVACLHLNDSVRPFASRRDRHAHFGEGEMGLEVFERLLTDPRLQAIPMVIETEPGPDREDHRRDLETLRGLLGG